MIYNQNFPYFQQTFKKNYFGRAEAEAPEGKTGNKKVTDEEKTGDTMQNPKEIQEFAKQEVDEQEVDEQEVNKQEVKKINRKLINREVNKQEVNKQDDFDKNGAESKTDESADLPGFEKVGPGLFQFKNPKWTTPAAQPQYGQPKKQELQQQVHYNPPPASEGFARVNGIPGPYQNFPTPVYQFT